MKVCRECETKKPNREMLRDNDGDVLDICKECAEDLEPNPVDLEDS